MYQHTASTSQVTPAGSPQNAQGPRADCPALCARAFGGCLRALRPAQQSLMALPSTLGQPVPPPLDLWLLAWRRAHRFWIAALRIRVAVGYWWRRQHPHGSRNRSFNGSDDRGVQCLTPRPQSLWFPSQWTCLSGQRLNRVILHWFSVSSPALWTLRDAHIHHGQLRTPRGRQTSRGRIPKHIERMGREAVRSFLAHRAQLARAAPLSALQTPFHTPSMWTIAEVRKQRDLSGRY